MAIPVLIDTNIWIYALTDFGKRGDKAREILSVLEGKDFLILAPLQVMKELGRVLIDKKKLPAEEVIEILEELTGSVRFLQETPADVITAIALRTRYKFLQYFDAIIIASALNNGIEIIFSEDLPSPSTLSLHGKEVHVINPLTEDFEELISQL